MGINMQWNQRILHQKFEGVVSARDLLKYRDRIAGDERFNDLDVVVNDLSAAHLADDINLTCVQETAALDYAMSLTNPRLRYVMIASDPRMLAHFDLYNQTGLARHPLIVVPDSASAAACVAELLART